MLGDPLSLIDDLGTGVADFFIKTRSEMIGDAHTKGEGVRRLARALVGGTFGSASKITGSLEDMVRSATGLDGYLGDDILYGHGGGYDDSMDRERHTASLSSGLRHGGDVFVNSVVTGFSGLYEGPVSGFSR